ncbi:MAG: GNAT family N-acetyltransferase [Nitrospira sp.]|nr:GNAT family N-acetyltransferase [Nitrospira sp.]
MPMVLTRIPKESPIGATFGHIARFKYVVVSKETASSAYTDSTGKWDEYFRSISGQRRYDYQRKRKRLERVGQVTIRIESPGSISELSCLLEEVYRVEGAGWKGRAGSALIANESIRGFIARFSELACKKGSLRVCFLSVQGIAIATILGIEEEGRFWVLKIGYDEQWARCSPGIQITMETIRYAFEKHLEAYEFLGSEEPWQAMWPHRRHHFVTLALYPISLKGLHAFSRDGLRLLLSRATRERAFAKYIT